MFGNNLWAIIYDMKRNWINFRNDLIRNLLKAVWREETTYYTIRLFTKEVMDVFEKVLHHGNTQVDPEVLVNSSFVHPEVSEVV